MSFDDHRGKLHAVRAFMQAAQQDIAHGERKGATILYSRTGGKSFHERQTVRQRWSSVVRFAQTRRVGT